MLYSSWGNNHPRFPEHIFRVFPQMVHLGLGGRLDGIGVLFHESHIGRLHTLELSYHVQTQHQALLFEEAASSLRLVPHIALESGSDIPLWCKLIHHLEEPLFLTVAMRVIRPGHPAGQVVLSSADGRSRIFVRNNKDAVSQILQGDMFFPIRLLQVDDVASRITKALLQRELLPMIQLRTEDRLAHVETTAEDTVPRVHTELDGELANLDLDLFDLKTI